MKIQFPKGSTAQIIKQLSKIIVARSISQIVSLSSQDENLMVKISKLGTSTLTFTRTDNAKGAQFSLTAENIALTHRAFQREVKSQFCTVVEEAGGKVSGA